MNRPMTIEGELFLKMWRSTVRSWALAYRYHLTSGSPIRARAALEGAKVRRDAGAAEARRRGYVW